METGPIKSDPNEIRCPILKYLQDLIDGVAGLLTVGYCVADNSGFSI